MNKFLFFTFLVCLSIEVGAKDPVVFIVNTQNTVTSISLKDLKDYFFKRKKTWPDGKVVRFIDRNESPQRAFFLEHILKKSSEDLDAFWIGQKLYSGDSAPVQASSDDMAIQFVSTFPEAIGYVSDAAAIKDKNIKTISVLEDKD